MEDHGKSDGWDEVLEEDDELTSVCKYPISTSFTSRRSKCVKKPTFSLRGYDFVPLNVKTDNFCTGGQEATSAVPSTRVSQTMVAEQLENFEEQAEDLAPEFALPTKKENTSVSDLLDNLQRRSGSFVRTPSLLHQYAPSISTREQEFSSRVPPTKASQALMDEPFENVKGQTEDLPSEFPRSIRKANLSVAELLEDLQGRSGSNVETSHQHTRAKHWKQKFISSEKKTLAILGDRSIDNEDPLEHVIDGTSSEEEDDTEKHSSLVNRNENQQTMADLFQEVFNPTNMDGCMNSMRSTGAKHWKPKFLSSEKKTLAILGDRSIDSEDPLEHVIDGTSSEEEDAAQKHLSLVNKNENQQTMADLFQEVFNPTNMDGAMNSMRSTGAGIYGRMQQILQMEKDWHAEFLRRYSREQGYTGDLKGTTVEIMSRSLEGKLTVCSCMFQEKSNDTAVSNASANSTMDESRTRRTIIFSPKICDNVDLLVGNIIHIFPPWKEVKIQEEHVIICTYFSHHRT